MTAQRRIGRRLFVALLVLHTVSCVALGGISLVNFPFAVQTGFGIPYSSTLDILGVVIGLELLFLGGISALSAVWTSRGNISGVTTGMAVGLYMLMFGIVAFLKLGQTSGLLVDSSRGLLTLVFGVMAYREFKTQQG